MTAFGAFPLREPVESASSTSAGSRFHVSRLQSTNMGSAPTQVIGLAEATNVNVEHRTVSPRPTPRIWRAR